MSIRLEYFGTGSERRIPTKHTPLIPPKERTSAVTKAGNLHDLELRDCPTELQNTSPTALFNVARHISFAD